ncbi:hypothetical protein [Megavirus chiliensis]|uniref:Uncharacterized protein n=1 Tax=Megavirus chiliensis TaxID=1094892 RepID=A0AAJ6MKB3_9VIRU
MIIFIISEHTICLSYCKFSIEELVVYISVFSFVNFLQNLCVEF